MFKAKIVGFSFIFLCIFVIPATSDARAGCELKTGYMTDADVADFEDDLKGQDPAIYATTGLNYYYCEPNSECKAKHKINRSKQISWSWSVDPLNPLVVRNCSICNTDASYGNPKCSCR